MPKKVTVRDEPEGPVFTYALHNWGFSIIFLFGLVFTIFPLIVFFQTLGELIVSLFMLLFTAGGLALAYWSLVMMINRSEIRLPLPWKRPADIPVNEILALSQQTYYNRGQSMAGSGGLGVSVGTSIRNEKLVAIVSARNGQKKAVTLIPMMEYAAAQFLEGQIETRLGLRQAMSHTEQEMAVEFAQIEEKRILAAQGKGFIFLFILMAVGCLVGGAWWLVSLWSQQVEARASQAWPSTVGVSTAYWITRHEPDSDDNWDTYYTASIEYTY
ncbi:MAG: DUF3592 domain-containing protein, partial [Anaerolineales bacterium]|nr:DUF3592 domain-containing protein [Anaerolineales bacterium]